MRLWLVLVITCLIFFSAKPALAQAESIGQSVIYPSTPWYFLKTVREIIEFKLSTTQETKVIRQFEFANRRIREVNSLVNYRKEEWIPPTLERYYATVTPLKGWAGAAEKTWIGDRLAGHLFLLADLHSQVENPQAKRAIRVAVTRLTVELDLLAKELIEPQLSQIHAKITPAKIYGCNFLVKEATSSALTQAERVLLTSQARECKSAPI